MKQILRKAEWKLCCLRCLYGDAAHVHDLQIFGAALLHAETTFAEFIANGVLLFVRQRRIGNDIIVELIEELCNAVRLVLNATHVFLQLTIVAFLADIQKSLEIFGRHQTGQLENVVSRDFRLEIATF